MSDNNVDLAQAIVSPATGLSDNAKADAWDAFNQSPNADDLAQKLQAPEFNGLSDDVKASLWDAKNNPATATQKLALSRPDLVAPPPAARGITPDSEHAGQQVNDVGNAVIVPKPSESFADTMQRAAQYGKTVTPGQVNEELATAPKKAAEVIVAAPVIGAAGVAGLNTASPAESPIPSVLAHTINGVKAVGAWANANPVQAYLLYNLLKEAVPGAKRAMGLIKEAPVPE